MTALRRELELFFTALMFFTRLPCQKWIGHSEELLNHSVKYFPLVGWIVGGAGAIVWSTASIVFPNSVALVLSMASTILVTGGFHEDGLADALDGFGGGWTKEQILTIMKDSRIGSYGAIALWFAFMGKYASLSSLPTWSIPTTLLAAHASSRLVAVSYIYLSEYVRDDAGSKSKPLAYRLSKEEMKTALVLGGLPLLLLGWRLVPVVAALVVLGVWLGNYFRRRIGGYTGDCLGAAQQLAELTVYLTLAGLA